MSLEGLNSLIQLESTRLEIAKISEALPKSTSSNAASFLEFIMSFFNQMLILMIDAWYSLVSTFN